MNVAESTATQRPDESAEPATGTTKTAKAARTAKSAKATVPAPRKPQGSGAAAAAEAVTMRHQVTFTLPVVGRVWLGEPRHLPFYAGVGLLAVAGVIDWPVAAVIVVGKALADNAHRQVLREFGEALEEGS